MKVLFVTPSYYPATRFGGPSQSVHLLAKHIISQGIDLEVVTTNAGQEKPENFTSKFWNIQEGVKVKYFSFWGYEHYNFSIPLFIYLFLNIYKYDVVHITAVWNFPVWAASFLCKIFKKPYIISPRGTLYPETIALGSSKFKKIYFKWIAKRCMNNASFIHYTAEDEKNAVEQYLKITSPGRVISNGIDTMLFETPINTKLDLPTEYILFLGRIHPKKGLDILLEAFAKFSRQFPHIQLVIAGPNDSNYQSELKILLEKLFISDKIIFTGELNFEEKKYAFKNALFFALTSYSENFGMAVVEAILMNCPVLISDKVAISEDLKAYHAAKICQTNSESIYINMKELYENKSERKLLSEKGKEAALALYDIKNVGIKYIHLYLSILKK